MNVMPLVKSNALMDYLTEVTLQYGLILSVIINFRNFRALLLEVVTLVLIKLASFKHMYFDHNIKFCGESTCEQRSDYLFKF